MNDPRVISDEQRRREMRLPINRVLVEIDDQLQSADVATIVAEVCRVHRLASEWYDEQRGITQYLCAGCRFWHENHAEHIGIEAAQRLAELGI